MYDKNITNVFSELLGNGRSSNIALKRKDKVIPMANRMILNETSYIGPGAIASIVDEAKGRAFRKALVVTDKDLIKFGVASKVTGLLDQNGLAYESYSDVKANPTIKYVQDGVVAFKAAGADYLIAIGGGSAMDTAKGIGIIIANPEYADVSTSAKPIWTPPSSTAWRTR